MMAGKIVYKDIAPGAAEDAAFTASGQTSFSNLDLSADSSAKKDVTLEFNRWTLDGTFEVYDGHAVHYWSEALTDANCDFSVPPVLTVVFDSQYTTTGITLEFDAAANEWCSELNIKWYQGSTLKADEDFYPNATTYFCKKAVVAYNKVVITFKKTSLPHRRLRLEKVLFGIVREFGMDEIEAANAINEMDLLASSLPASQLDWTLHSKNDVEYIFQLKQPVEMFCDNGLIGVYYISRSERMSGSRYKITAQDAVGVLGEQPFAGGNYISGVSAKTLFTNIVGGAFDIDFGNVADTTLYGILEAKTKRDALQQVLFAWGKCLRTDGGYTLQVFDAPSDPAVIAEAETYEGVSVRVDPIVTRVVVTGHSYSVNGDKYNDNPTLYTVDNPDVTANSIANVISVTDATLVSTHNGAAVAQRVFDYYMRRRAIKSKVIYGGQRLGDCLTQPTAWGTSITGNAVSVAVKMSGLVAADIESLEVAP